MDFVFDFLSILFSDFLLLYVWNERLLGCPIISLVFNVHALNLLRVHFKRQIFIFRSFNNLFGKPTRKCVSRVSCVYSWDRKYAKSQFWWKRFLIQKDDKGRSIYHVIVALCIRETHINEETSFYGDKAFKKDVMHSCLLAWEVLFILPDKLYNKWPRL